MTFFDSTLRAGNTHASKFSSRRDANTFADLEALAQLLDAKWNIPGTSIRFGIDALAGLVPLVGDAATGLVSVYIVGKARNYGASNLVIARMVGNVVLDTVIGSIPVLGSVFDVYFKANKRNIHLLRRHLERTGR